MAGGMRRWEVKKLKFLGKSPSASSAVMGAVVSKPTAWKTNSFFGSRLAISTASETAYTIRTSAPAALASKSEDWLPGTRRTSPKQVMTIALFRPAATASSISAAGTIHTGQPGPAITSTFSGKRLRKPKWVIVHSWVPQTWQILILPFFGRRGFDFCGYALCEFGVAEL